MTTFLLVIFFELFLISFFLPYRFWPILYHRSELIFFSFDAQIKFCVCFCFEDVWHLITFYKSQILLIFFRLKMFLLSYFWSFYRLIFLPTLIFYFVVLVCFCFKTSLIYFDRSSFEKCRFWFLSFGFSAVFLNSFYSFSVSSL